MGGGKGQTLHLFVLRGLLSHAAEAIADRLMRGRVEAENRLGSRLESNYVQQDGNTFDNC